MVVGSTRPIFFSHRLQNKGPTKLKPGLCTTWPILYIWPVASSFDPLSANFTKVLLRWLQLPFLPFSSRLPFSFPHSLRREEPEDSERERGREKGQPRLY